MGYVKPKHNGGLRTNPINWTTEGLRPGMCYRFFVCSRYAGLPASATAPPPCIVATCSTEPGTSPEWPDEHFDGLRADAVAWEASLSRLGLWSPAIRAAHLPRSVVRPMTVPSCHSGEPLAASTVSSTAEAALREERSSNLFGQEA